MLFLREASFHDAEEIAKAHVASWNETYVGVLPQVLMDGNVVSDRTNYWKYSIQTLAKKTKIYVAELWGKDSPGIVGFGMCGPELVGLTEYEGEIQGLYLCNAGKGLGVGRKLMVKMAQYLVSLGYTRSCVWALMQNENAKDFYRYMGAKDVGCRYLTVDGATIQEYALGWHDITHLAEDNIEVYHKK